MSNMDTVIRDVMQSAAGSYANNIAIKQDNREISYGQLCQSVLNVSVKLQQSGLCFGDRVSLYVKNSIEYVVLYYAIWKCGCVVVSLNTEAKARNVIKLIKHSGSRLFIYDKNIEESNVIISDTSIEKYSIPTISLFSGINRGIIDNGIYPLPSDIACIIYTSGTTGEPKGVTLSHKNLYSNMRSILQYLQITENDKLITVLPFYYCYGNSVMHTHLMKGACLILIKSMMFPNRVLQSVETLKATSISGVASTFIILLTKTKLEKYDLRSLKYITQAGGPMPASITKKLIEKLPNSKIYIMYGQTEASARLSYLDPSKLTEKINSVGKPVSGVEILIKNDDKEEVRPGETGELYVRGDNVMLGYWKNKSLTSQVINKNGWLRTGDLARLDQDGYLYIMGRSIEMIKSGAHLINPVEIEDVLQELPLINECAVVGVEDALLGMVMRAYIVSNDKAIDPLQLKRYCSEHLPRFKVPKYIEFIDSLPKTSAGKIKKYVLRQ